MAYQVEKEVCFFNAFLMGMQQNIFFDKNIKMANERKLRFSKTPILNILSQKSQELIFGSVG